MAIKKLQNNFTTPEQSKILLELGVTADSADCYYDIFSSRPIVKMPIDCFADKVINEDYIPCWSAGRLIEIFETCTGKTFERNDVYNVFSDIFTTIESASLNHNMDFSKLEE